MKKKYFIRFRFFAIFAVSVLVMAASFLSYMLDANLNQDKYIASWEKLSTDGNDKGNDNLGAAVVNPVPKSAELDVEKAELHLENSAFFGDGLMKEFSEKNGLKNVFTGGFIKYSTINETELLVKGKSQKALSVLAALPQKNIYVMVANNGSGDTAQIEKFVKNLAAEFKGRVYVCAITPVSAKYEEEKGVLNSDIDVYNSELLKICNKLGVNFLDFNTPLKGMDMKLKSIYSRSDGAANAPPDEMYKAMLDYLLTHIAL